MDTTSITAESHPSPAAATSSDGPASFGSPQGSLSDRIGERFPGRPIRVGAAIDAAGVVVMAVLLIGLGLLLTHVVLDGAVGRWDTELNRRLVETRSAMVNGWSAIGSMFGDTMTVIGVATVATVLLALRRAWAKAAFLVGALLIEVTSFVITTFVIDRNRPRVPRLDAAPPTSSFPSGHTAASIVLFVGLALIVTSFTRNVAVRVAVWAIAVLVPAAVAISRMQRGMHHATDIVGSVIGALGCLLISMLAVRSAIASTRASEEAAS
jgi:undecaprenyl-diphosphatase